MFVHTPNAYHMPLIVCRLRRPRISFEWLGLRRATCKQTRLISASAMATKRCEEQGTWAADAVSELPTATLSLGRSGCSCSCCRLRTRLSMADKLPLLLPRSTASVTTSWNCKSDGCEGDRGMDVWTVADAALLSSESVSNKLLPDKESSLSICPARVLRERFGPRVQIQAGTRYASFEGVHDHSRAHVSQPAYESLPPDLGVEFFSASVSGVKTRTVLRR